MRTSIVTVDAFTDVPFSGNPAAVCLLEEKQEESWMQKVAKEMNLSETAFLVKRDGREPASYDLRWFTPLVEVKLCGHATLASAHFLWEDGAVAHYQEIRFHTKSGVLKAAPERDWIRLDFPAFRVRPLKGSTKKLAKALGAKVKFAGVYGTDYLAEVDNESVVRKLSPDFALLRSLPTRGVAVTARANKGRGYDFVSRFFAPKVGIDEDPVTGSAHCGLGPYWTERLGKDEVVGYQASARGGIVKVKVRGDRALLGGKAVTIMRGRLQ